LKVGLLIYGNLSTTSGGYLYDRKLVETLERCGDTVEVFSLPYRGYLAHLGDNFAAGLRRRLQQAAVDVLLEDELNHPSIFMQDRWLTGKYLVVSIVHHLRCDEDHPPALRWIYRLVERRYLRSVDGFVYNSLATRSSVEALVESSTSGVVAYPGRSFPIGSITEAEVIERALAPGPLRLLFIGNIIPRKNLHVLLRAIAQIPAGLYRLDVIGDPGQDRRYAARISRLAGDLRLEDRVRFLGKVSQAELRQHLSTHQVMVLPSSHEGFGIAYLEGFEYGMPAVGANRGGAVELIEHRKTGYRIRPGNAGEIAGAILELAGDRNRLAEMSLSALRRSGEFPTWEETGLQVRDFLMSLLRSENPPSTFSYP